MGRKELPQSRRISQLRLGVDTCYFCETLECRANLSALLGADESIGLYSLADPRQGKRYPFGYRHRELLVNDPKCVVMHGDESSEIS